MPAPWQRQASSCLCQQNAASPRMQVFKLRKSFALLCTVWAIQCFSNYIGTQKVIIETCHQTVTFLNSQRIRDGVVTKARIATWLMTLQGWTLRQVMPKTTNPHLETGLRPAKTVQRTRCTPQQNRKNRHNRNWQITGTSRRMCVKECPQHMSMAAPTIARAVYKLERVWSGSTMTRA